MSGPSQVSQSGRSPWSNSPSSCCCWRNLISHYKSAFLGWCIFAQIFSVASVALVYSCQLCLTTWYISLYSNHHFSKQKILGFPSLISPIFKHTGMWSNVGFMTTNAEARLNLDSYSSKIRTPLSFTRLRFSLILDHVYQRSIRGTLMIYISLIRSLNSYLSLTFLSPLLCSSEDLTTLKSPPITDRQFLQSLISCSSHQKTS